MGTENAAGQRLTSHGLYTDIRCDAGHFVHADDPLQYASAVSAFVRSVVGDLSGTGRVPATGW